jgi:8-oxo-dGTP pyrophosphatase MutT (NUDIX family)
MRWTVHGERTLYDSDWVRLTLVDVEPPSGARYEHHVVRIPQPAAATVVRRGGEILLLWRHRFITDSWGWEVPAGEIQEGEQPEEAAVRETLEETGWRPGPLHELGSYFPMNGRSDQRFHVFAADGAEQVGDPSDPAEAERIEWVVDTRVRELLRDGSITDGYSLVALYRALGS